MSRTYYVSAYDFDNGKHQSARIAQGDRGNWTVSMEGWPDADFSRLEDAMKVASERVTNPKPTLDLVPVQGPLPAPKPGETWPVDPAVRRAA